MLTQNTISPEQLVRQNDTLAVNLLDVRTPAEFREAHASMATNIPLETLDPEAVVRLYGSDEPLYVICQNGNRSQQACRRLVKAGHSSVVNVLGGTDAWQHATLPFVCGKKAVSLERQVRMAAGLIVLSGSLLGLFGNPLFGLIPACVGMGLLVAGITDTCGMAMLLARMPWNQVSGCRDRDRTTAEPSGHNHL
jgi:rhodanese-related sulfurtransferase